MILKILVIALVTYTACYVNANSVVCYYNSKSSARTGQGRLQIHDLDPALPLCTHLVYGYAAINSGTNKLIPLNENLDVTRNNYRAITDLKRRYPGLKILLSVGGFADEENADKYKTILESAETRISFVNSAHTLVKAYGFDGLDLGWEFPTNKPKQVRGTFGKIWSGIKGWFKSDVQDEKAQEHKEQFTALARETKNIFRHDGLLVSLSVLPNVNSSVYYDTRALIQHLDLVILHGYDYYTPARNPKEADYPAPLYELIDRKSDENVDALVRYWLDNGAQSYKLILGIPTYGRAWKMDDDSEISGVPPVRVDGAGQAGPYTQEAGLLSYPEVCSQIANPNHIRGNARVLRKVNDPARRKGTYAFRLPDENEEGGIWVGYEDLETVGNKASYARAKALGGVAIVDLSLDDFRGLCTGDKYPLLRAARTPLGLPAQPQSPFAPFREFKNRK